MCVVREMSALHERFVEECGKLDVLNSGVGCNTEFMRKYLAAYEYYVIYARMPDDNRFKMAYACLLSEAIKACYQEVK